MTAHLKLNISAAQIAELSARKHVNSIVVTNFLCSLGNMDANQAYLQMSAASKAYRWNAETVNAVADGIEMASVPL